MMRRFRVCSSAAGLFVALATPSRALDGRANCQALLRRAGPHCAVVSLRPLPSDGKRFQEIVEFERSWLPAIKYRLHDGRCKERQAEHSADVGLVCAFLP
jgi:hypothetical protein